VGERERERDRERESERASERDRSLMCHAANSFCRRGFRECPSCLLYNQHDLGDLRRSATLHTYTHCVLMPASYTYPWTFRVFMCTTCSSACGDHSGQRCLCRQTSGHAHSCAQMQHTRALSSAFSPLTSPRHGTFRRRHRASFSVRSASWTPEEEELSCSIIRRRASHSAYLLL
jgi:hypothetical protein